MKPYIPDTLPLDSIEWAAHVSLVGKPLGDADVPELINLVEGRKVV